MGSMIPFNPLDKINLANSVGNALIDTEPVPLSGLQAFEGSGVYSLYYVGDFYAYQPLAELNRLELIAPIYVGKADSKGKRKGGFIEDSSTGNALYKRLCDHANSISQASNLDIADFFCRHLVVDDLWISLGESLMISRHSPVWNVLVEGFGNHNPGKGRIAGKRPLWDMLHPGRSWADSFPENEVSAEKIGQQALSFLSERYTVIPNFAGSRVKYDVVETSDE